MERTVFPFSAIVAQEDFKLCLELTLVDRSIGGVLVLGDKGTGKTTTVRSISQLMKPINPNFNFVNLPIGASEDRVLGSIDLEKLINEKKQVLQKGLLAQANQGILYIDEINLLNDYLIDILLDATATGGYYLEREGLSTWLESNFSLIGTMNPEEGELRPQLLDRFGLSVNIHTPNSLSIRKLIAQRRIAFEQNSDAFIANFQTEEEKIRYRISQAKEHLSKITIPDEIYEYAVEQSIRHQVEGLRADILLVKTAQAYTALQNQRLVTTEFIDKIAPFVLNHRSKNPNPPNNNSNNPANHQGKQQKEEQNSHPKSFSPQEQNKIFHKENTIEQLRFFNSHNLNATRKGLHIKESQNLALHKLYQDNQEQDIDIFKTVKNYTIKANFELIYKSNESKSKLYVYFLIDSSGSMARKKQISYVKGLIHQSLNQNKGKRIKFAVIALINGSASICQPLTEQSKQLFGSLDKLPTGGKTNLSAGFQEVYSLIQREKPSKKSQQQLYIFTDGRINCSNNPSQEPVKEAVKYYYTFLKPLTFTQVINTENSFIKLGKAKELAIQLKSNYINI